MDIMAAGETAEKILFELIKVVSGQDRVVEQMVISLIAGGHSLIEGVPARENSYGKSACPGNRPVI